MIYIQRPNKFNMHSNWGVYFCPDSFRRWWNGFELVIRYGYARMIYIRRRSDAIMREIYIRRAIMGPEPARWIVSVERWGPDGWFSA